MLRIGLDRKTIISETVADMAIELFGFFSTRWRERFYVLKLYLSSVTGKTISMSRPVHFLSKMYIFWKKGFLFAQNVCKVHSNINKEDIHKQ